MTVRVVVAEDSLLAREGVQIFSKLDLGEEQHVSRRVKAAITFLAEDAGWPLRGASACTLALCSPRPHH
jgi:hypothetical protein